MELKNIKKLSQQWVSMTLIVLKEDNFPSDMFKNLLKESYAVLNHYHKDALIPKEVTELLLEMDGFLYFVSLINGKEGITDMYFPAAHMAVEGVKKGFLDGKYECEFPLLRVYDNDDKPLTLDLENGYLEDLF